MGHLAVINQQKYTAGGPFGANDNNLLNIWKSDTLTMTSLSNQGAVTAAYVNAVCRAISSAAMPQGINKTALKALLDQLQTRELTIDVVKPVLEACVIQMNAATTAQLRQCVMDVVNEVFSWVVRYCPGVLTMGANQHQWQQKLDAWIANQ